MTRYHFGAFAIALGAFAMLTALPEIAAAQQMGKEGYNPSAGRNPSIAAQLRLQDQIQRRSGSAGLGALEQFVTNYNSSSTSIGNMNTVTQNVGDGATASVGQSTDQQSDGDQGSSATTDVDQSSEQEINTSEALIEALSDGEGAPGGQSQ